MAKRLSSIAKFRKQLILNNPDAPKTVEEPKGKKKSPFFMVIDHMGSDKCPWELLTDQERNAVSQYAIMKGLCRYEEYLPILNFVSNMNLRDRDFYELMCCIMRTQKHYFKGAKKEVLDEELIRSVMHEFFYTRQKAIEYVEDIEPEEAEYIRNRWKDVVKEEMADK